jgi:hypothetical protein
MAAISEGLGRSRSPSGVVDGGARAARELAIDVMSRLLAEQSAGMSTGRSSAPRGGQPRSVAGSGSPHADGRLCRASAPGRRRQYQICVDVLQRGWGTGRPNARVYRRILRDGSGRPASVSPRARRCYRHPAVSALLTDDGPARVIGPPVVGRSELVVLARARDEVSAGAAGSW